ncbi:MAG: hypothetical protein WKG52_00670 [Variovorax sp.]
MNPFWKVLICVGILYALWIHFLAVMALLDARERQVLTTAAKVPGYPVLGAGLVLDFLGNLIATFLFVELPREFTVSSRVKRHCRDSKGWRREMATWIRDNWLKPFDRTGGHD